MTEHTGSNLEPVCSSHVDRVTYIKCTRCDNPLCTECMIPASVGFQCPTCVGNTRVPKVVTPVGGASVEKPYVTYALIAVNIVVFLLQFSMGIDESSREFGMWPAGIAIEGSYWSLMTSAFMHASPLHIAFNMYILYVMGATLERIFGHTRFIALYLLAALGGSVASYWFSDLRTVSVGASGAVFGLMGAFIVAGRRLRFDITQVLILLGINLAFGFIGEGVDWRAHLGGMAVGAIVAGIFVFAPRKHQTLIQGVGCAAVLIVLIVAVMVRTTDIQNLLAPFVPGIAT